MGRYDTMQVCLRGHRITEYYETQPERRQNTCMECGSDTIHQCPECGTEIRGQYHRNRRTIVVGKSPEVKDYCHECGSPYPWANVGETFSEVDSGVLDPELADRALPEYEDGHYQSTVKTAFVVLEERVRDRGEFSNDDYGANLMTNAFRSDGPLAMGETSSEEDGTMLLYQSSVTALRNPVNHRFVDRIDEDYARDVLHTVNLLLRTVDQGNID